MGLPSKGRDGQHNGSNSSRREKSLEADPFGRQECASLTAISHTMEMMLAAISVIWGGVCERHPRIRIASLESGGGRIAPWLDRMDQAASGATAARSAAELELTWVAADLDRPCDIGLRGWCFGLRLISLGGARCLLIGLLSGHRLRPLDPHRACRDAYTATSPAPGARRGGDQEGRRRQQECFL